jgi:hypothetical protein
MDIESQLKFHKQNDEVVPDEVESVVRDDVEPDSKPDGTLWSEPEVVGAAVVPEAETKGHQVVAIQDEVADEYEEDLEGTRNHEEREAVKKTVEVAGPHTHLTWLLFVEGHPVVLNNKVTEEMKK